VDEFHELLDTLCRRGVAILMVTHDLFGACEVSAKIGLLRDGRLVQRFDAGRDPNGRFIHVDVETVKRAFAGREAA
jgi:ABC-2 type transport system ATP-binding protein